PVQAVRQHARGRVLPDTAAERRRGRQTARSAYGADRLWGQRSIRGPSARSGPGITVSSAHGSLQTPRAVYPAPARGRGDEVHRRCLMLGGPPLSPLRKAERALPPFLCAEQAPVPSVPVRADLATANPQPTRRNDPWNGAVSVQTPTTRHSHSAT